MLHFSLYDGGFSSLGSIKIYIHKSLVDELFSHNNRADLMSQYSDVGA